MFKALAATHKEWNELKSIAEVEQELEQVETEIAERQTYHGPRSFGDHQIEQQLAVKAGHLQDALLQYDVELQHERAEMLAEEYALERAHPTFAVTFSADELDWLFRDLLPMVAECRREFGHGDAPDILYSIKQWQSQAEKQGYVGGVLR